MMRRVGIWAPPGQRPSAFVRTLAERVAAVGGAAAVGSAGPTVGYAHGERHDLWWEFSLAASFAWQARVHRLHPAYAAQRTAKLTTLFGLTDLLARPVEALTPAERSRANLAVALLPQPDLLLWEEPFAAMPGRAWMELCREVRRLCRSEGLTVIMVAESRKEDAEHDRHHQDGADDLRDRRRARTPRRPAVAAGALRP